MKTSTYLFVFFLNLSHLYAADFYWKGGDGEFNDPSKWAIGAVSGPTAPQAPISTDNVLFTAGAINGTTINITISSNSNCHDFWIDPAITTGSMVNFINGLNQTLDIYGSMELAVTSNFKFQGILRFRSVLNGTELFTQQAIVLNLVT